MLIIHRTILRRLFLSWLLISTLIGGAVFYYGIEQIDDRLVAMATAESGKLSESKLSLINSPNHGQGLLHTVLGDFAREHFVVIQFYNRDRQRIGEDVNPSFPDIEDYLKQNPHGFPFDNVPHYQKFVFHDQTVLQAMVPIKDRRGALVGYFEGVFAIDEATLGDLRSEVLVSLATTLIAVLITTLVLYPVILSLNRNVLSQARNLLLGNIELMEVLGSAVAMRDSDTNIHTNRVSIYAVRLAEACGLGGEAIRHLIAGAFLHDVGKIGISDAILLKPGPLEEAELNVMRTHVTLGVDIIKKSGWLGSARDVVEFHHERYDGTGYPKGLRGEEIPINARIFAIVDVFDALTSQRPYKAPMPFGEAMALIMNDAGRHFDPTLLAKFSAIIYPLYCDLNRASDADVERQLRSLIEHYFFNSGNSPAGG